ncbi:hypothetical protein GGS26DRAFT_180258 [Hypomontagnella submonticulosa]|nr:hypothetical protein GGS26DRAFT_180258 [Hypomontagnella submonticulosa]
MTSATPVILCGHFEEVGKAFSDGLQPNFEVVFFTTSPQSSLTAIPQVFAGTIPSSSTGSTKIGTGNLSHGLPKAVVVVAGSPATYYDDAWVERARKEISTSGKRVPILKPDNNPGTAHQQQEKAAAAAERAAKALKKLADEGKLDGEDDGVYHY